MMVGNATTNAKPHAFNQIRTIPSTNPILKTLITNDIMHDMSKDMKNENTYAVYFWGINWISYLSGT